MYFIQYSGIFDLAYLQLRNRLVKNSRFIDYAFNLHKLQHILSASDGSVFDTNFHIYTKTQEFGIRNFLIIHRRHEVSRDEVIQYHSESKAF